MLPNTFLNNFLYQVIIKMLPSSGIEGNESESIIATNTAEEMVKIPDIPNPSQSKTISQKNTQNNENSNPKIYLAGNYLKYSRQISQSPWLVDETAKIESLEEIIGHPLKEISQSASAILHASGREDVDVRMLGCGRPFIIELKDPKVPVSSENMENLQSHINSINKDVQVKNLRIVDKKYFEEIRLGEEGKLKAYSAICWLSKPLTQADISYINSIENLVLDQKTPIRVLHRRAIKVRYKSIIKMHMTLINRHFAELRVISSGGTYIKEFVHGDFGRTVPSLGTLLNCKADILQLDVLGLGWNIGEVEDLLISEIE
ncbi:PUS10 [Blepharisma stoltei]|uniref:tRNA pseudouridine(55) synthase n=1 Tax=Blepharisma stoltei TaxID=1481888 RepID=A0AAU9K1P5_9CILI|nr:unnamed protein product [Blepharisma stoltei]